MMNVIEVHHMFILRDWGNPSESFYVFVLYEIFETEKFGFEFPFFLQVLDVVRRRDSLNIFILIQ